MNILFLTYQGDIAGSTNSIAYLTQGLAEKGHNVYLGCRKESLLYNNLKDSAVHLIPMTFRSKFDMVNIRQIKEAVEKFDIHIINAQSSKDRYTSIFAKIIYGLHVKIVHTRRQISKSSGGILQSLFYMTWTDKIVAVSEGVKQSLIKNGIRSSHIKVIYNGTPKEKYQNLDPNKSDELKQRWAIKPTDFVIGCVSRRKNQEQLIEALARLNFAFKVIFIGVDAVDTYQKLVEKYQLQDRVIFAGKLPGEETLNAYPLFDVKILPSTMEGLSQSLLEAMYLRVPVIATKAAGNIDLIENDTNGLFFTDKDITGLVGAICRIKEQTVDIEKLIENGFKTASVNYSIERTVNRFEAFFIALLSEDSALVAAPA